MPLFLNYERFVFLQKSYVIQVQIQLRINNIQLMSDIEQLEDPFRPFPLQPQPNINEAQLLVSHFPQLKDVLTCQLDDLLTNIQKLSLLTEEARLPILRKTAMGGSTKIDNAFMERFKMINNWNIDHLKLFADLQKISQFLRLDLNALYKIVIYEKIQNGLVFIDIFERLKHSPRRPPRGIQIPSSKLLQNCYKVTMTDIHKDDPAYEIYNKRKNGLNDEQLLKYRIKLLRQLIALPSLPQPPHFDPMNPAPLLYHNNNQKKEEHLAEVQNIYKLLDKVQYVWILEELLEIDCPLTAEYKKIIASLYLIKDEKQEQEIILQQSSKIKSKFLTPNALKKCFKVQRNTQSNLLSEGNILYSNEKIYIKYDITQLLNVNVEFIGSFKAIPRLGMQMNNNVPNIDEVAVKINLINTIEKIYLMINQISAGKQILIYEGNNKFRLIPHEKHLEIVQFCINMIDKLNEYGMIIKKASIISELLLNPQLILHLNMVLKMIARPCEEKCQNIFIKICQILKFLIVQNEQKMEIMKDKNFLTLFVQNVNTFVADQKIKHFNSRLQEFLINYLPKLFEFGLQIQKLSLQKIYELKLSTISSGRPRRFIPRMRMDPDDDFPPHMRDPNMEDRSSFQNFTLVFPGCIQYFNNRLAASVGSIMEQLQTVDIFQKGISSFKLRSLLSIYASQKINSDECLSNLFKTILNQHPTIFAQASSEINFTSLKNKLKVTNEEISEQFYKIHAKLSQGLAVETIPSQQLCQSITTTNKQMIDLANMINRLTLLLKMKQKNPTCPYIKELLEITLFMEQVESISLNRTVKHQASYTQQKLAAIKSFYRELGDKKMLYHTMAQISANLFQTCWNVLEQLDVVHLNILLKEFKIYFETMMNLNDKNLVLRLIKKTYRSLSPLVTKTGISLNNQLYNHNKQIIIQFLSLIHKEFSSTKRSSRDTVVMGDSYLRFVQSCKRQNKDASIQFNIIIIPHISESITMLINFIFFSMKRTRSIFNKKEYRGNQNALKIIRAVCCDVVTRFSTNFKIENLSFYNRFITQFQGKGVSPLPVQAELQNLLQIEQPNEPLVPLTKEQKQKILADGYVKILDKIYDNRNSKSQLQQLQNLFFQIVQNLSQKYKLPHQYRKLFSSVLHQMGENSQLIQIDDQIFKTQCSWIDTIISRVKDLKIQDVLSVNFIKQYLKLISSMLNNPEQYKESIPNSIIILEKLIPKNLNENREELTQYGIIVIQIINKVIHCSIGFKKLKVNILKNIVQSLIKAKCTEYNQYIRTFLNILSGQNISIGPLLSELIQKQSQLPSMQADIKGVFLKQSQNLVDESQDKISIRLNTFINIFKFKYGEDVAGFSNLTGKFVKKSIKKDEINQVTYLSYEKKNSFSYCEILKMNFNMFEPSDSIKIIINDLLSFPNNGTIQSRLQSLQDLLYYYPLLIPYVMLHPIKSQNNQEIEFIDYLVAKVSRKRIEYISNFLLFICLDHSCMAQLKDRTIFFAQYLCYRIIKKIINVGINKFTLVLVYELAQLKRFAYLSKLKITKNDKNSLITILIDHLKSSRQGFLYRSCDNNIIMLIMAILYKQDAVDNLKKCFIPKKNKQNDRFYKIINQSLIPFNVYFRRMLNNHQLQTRDDNISFTGNLITPFYPQIYDEIYMDEDYQPIQRLKYHPQASSKQQIISQFNIDNLQSYHLKSFSSAITSKRYENASRQMATEFNQNHRAMIQKINQSLFERQDREQAAQQQSSDEDGEPRSMRIGGRQATLTQRWRMEEEFGRRRGGRGSGRGRGMGRGIGRQHNPRYRTRQNRYAQQDFTYNENAEQVVKKTIQKQFEQSLNVIPSEQIIKQEKPSSTNFEDIKTGEQELQAILSQINEKLFLLNRDELNLQQLRGKSFLQKKEYLQLKNLELDFDYHKRQLSPEQFEQYCLGNAVKFSKLDETRREQVRNAEQIMYLLNLRKRYSKDSINDIIDAIDQNYQYINIPRTLSRSQSMSSQGDKLQSQSLLGQTFHFENNVIPIRAFTDIQEEILYEMLLSFYYVDAIFTSKHFMPFLQNKRVQNKLINTLLFLIKDAFNCKYFPNCIYKSKDNQWIKVPITQSNQKEQQDNFIERVFSVLQSVKNYSFHQDDNFLFEEIDNKGIFDITYEPIIKSNMESTYIPIYQILEYGFNSQIKATTIKLLKGVKQLPSHQIDKILQILQKSQTIVERQNEEHAMVMGRVYALPKKSLSGNFPYEILKDLYKTQAFKQKFKQIYTFGTKNPIPSFLTQLIETSIYTTQELKTFQLQFFAKKAQDYSTLMFLNKVIAVYSDQQLRQAKWIKEYTQILSKVISLFNNRSSNIEKEPISRILNLTNDLGFQIKRAIFDKQMEQRKAEVLFDYQQLERTPVISKKQKGIFLSAFQSLKNKPDSFWLSAFRVKFVNQNGKQESGFGDGVRREWFTLLSKDMVNLNMALFKRTQKNYYFFNPISTVNPRHLQYFQFIGKLIGYSLTKGSIMVSPSFSIILYKMMLGEEVTVDDILNETQDEQKFVMSIQNMINEVKTEEQFQQCGISLPFIYETYNILKDDKVQKKQFLQMKEQVIKQLHDDEEERKKLPQKINVMKVKQTHELKPGGANIFVTFDTMREFLDLFKKKIYQLTVDSIKRQFDAFMSGFKRIIRPKLIARFTAKELKLLIEGVSTVDIDDLQKYTRADNIDTTTISLLWSTLQGLSMEQRGMFIWFWTSSDKMAAEGAKVMGLSLSRSKDSNFLAHTCAKNLEVPRCQTKQQMETAVTVVLNSIKLGQAIIEDGRI